MALLREHGPLTDRELGQLLADAGFGYVEEVTEQLEELDDPGLGILPDGRNFALDVALDGRVLTHRLTAEEIAADTVNSDDFGPLLVLAPRGTVNTGFELLLRDADSERLAERGVADADWVGFEVLLLPRGALADRVPGDLIALSVTDGRLRLHRIDGELAAAPDLAPWLTELCDEQGVFHLENEMWQLMVDDPAVFAAPTLPLTEIIEAAGFDRHRDLVAPRGFDFEENRRFGMLEMLADRLDISIDAATAAGLFLGLVAAFDGKTDKTRDEVDALFLSSGIEPYSALAHPDVASSVLGDALDERGFSPAAIEQAAEWLLEHGSRKTVAAAHWFAGRAAEADGRVDEAERHYERTIAADGSFEPALIDLANYASDRGDAVRGLSLLGRVPGGDELPTYQLLQRFQPVDRPGLGRNDRCWCGSGRKYKVCHLGKAEHPLSERADWLYRKAVTYVLGSGWRDRLFELAEIRTAPDEERSASIIRGLTDPFIADVVLFECGAFAEFVERRGHLLPADELLLAQQWLLVGRSVHEVEAVRPGEGLTMRDLRTGDRHDVRERTASRRLRVGDVLCARVVPAGDTWQLFGGGEPIAVPQRAPLMAMLDDETTDPAGLVEFLSAPSQG